MNDLAPDPGPLNKGAPRSLREWLNRLRCMVLAGMPLPGIGTSVHRSARGTSFSVDSIVGGGINRFPFEAQLLTTDGRSQIVAMPGLLIDGFANPALTASRITIVGEGVPIDVGDGDILAIEITFSGAFAASAATLKIIGGSDDIVEFDGVDSIDLVAVRVPIASVHLERDGDTLTLVQYVRTHLRLDWCAYMGKTCRYPIPL